jgi:D-hexose-6-phosphate mutarotase
VESLRQWNGAAAGQHHGTCNQSEWYLPKLHNCNPRLTGLLQLHANTNIHNVTYQAAKQAGQRSHCRLHLVHRALKPAAAAAASAASVHIAL